MNGNAALRPFVTLRIQSERIGVSFSKNIFLQATVFRKMLSIGYSENFRIFLSFENHRLWQFFLKKATQTRRVF
jgi:hypothetical protein